MSNRLYRFIVITQISLIILLVLFVLNGELVLEKIRVSQPANGHASQSFSGELVKAEYENRYLL